MCAAPNEKTPSEDFTNRNVKRRRGGRYDSQRSIVWRHFDYDMFENKSRCRYCENLLKGKHPGNLRKHLKQHRQIFDEVEELIAQKRDISLARQATVVAGSPALVESNLFDQLTIDNQFLINKPMIRDGENSHYKDVLRAVTVLFVANSIPYSLLDSPEMAEFVRLLNPKFRLPNRSELAAESSELFSQLRSSIAFELDQAGKICIILDIVYRCGHSESPRRLVILAKYFDTIFGAGKTVFLGSHKLDGSYCAEKARLIVQSTLAEWNIPETKVAYYITNNGSRISDTSFGQFSKFDSCSPTINDDDDDDDDRSPIDDLDWLCEQILDLAEMDSNLAIGIENLIDKVGSDLAEYDLCETNHNRQFDYAKRVSCFVHQLTYVVRKCVDRSETLIDITRSVFDYAASVVKSIGTNELLMRNLGETKRLIDCRSKTTTFWIYTYYIIDSILHSGSLSEERVDVGERFDIQKRQQFVGLRDVLKPFVGIVNSLKDESLTISKVIPAVVDLLECLNEIRDGVVGTLRTTVKDLIAELERSFAYLLDHKSMNFSPIYLLATFLDPEYVVGLSKEQQRYCIKRLAETLTVTETSQIDLLPDREDSAGITVTAASSTSITTKKFEGFFKRWPQQDQRTVDDKTGVAQQLLRNQLDEYVNEAMLICTSRHGDSAVNALQFWTKRFSTCNEIAAYATSLLIVPTSTPGMEKIVSTVKTLLDGRRPRHGLNDGEMEQQLFTKVNLGYLLTRPE